MASKSPSTKSPSKVVPRAPRSSLKPTDVPGVFRNKAGVLVDADGIAVGFRDVKKADDTRFKEVLGRDPLTPLDVITGTAMDPRNPMHVRLDAAKAATPYLSPKLVAIQGVAGAPPIRHDMTNKSDSELVAMRAKMEELLGMMGTRG